MAASIFGSRTLRKLCNLARNQSCRHTSYYILLPEVPPDTPETNAIMRHNEIHKFDKLTPDKIVTGCAKMSLEFITKFDDLVESLADPAKPKTFDGIFMPIEELLVPMNYAFNTIHMLSSTTWTEDSNKAIERAKTQMARAKNERIVSETFYNALKELHADRAQLSPYQQRLLDLYLLEARLNGIELINHKEAKTFKEAQVAKFNHETYYYNKVTTHKGMFYQTIDDFADVKDMSRQILTLIAENKAQPEKGPWKVNLLDYVYEAFMESCARRDLRHNIWKAYSQVSCHLSTNPAFTTFKDIEDIRETRMDIAKMLGYQNFAQLSMETKMVGSVENVLNMLESYKQKFLPVAQEEIKSLSAFAKSKGHTSELKPWDISYFRRQQSLHQHGIVQDEIAQYFTLPSVLETLFNLSYKLFGVNIKQSQSHIEPWAKDVFLFDVTDDNDKLIANFLFDPYARPSTKLSGIRMEMGRDHSAKMGTTPISYLIMSLPRPMFRGQTAVMTYNDVLDLFFQFGTGLQQMLTTVPYSELAGQRSIEWDALLMCANFMRMLAMQPQVVKDMSGHHETDEKLPDNKVESLINSKNHMFGYDMCYQLFLSAFDIECHISQKYWKEIQESMYKMFMPVPLESDDWSPCSYLFLFSTNNTAATHYSFIWSQMLAADVFDAFKEAGLDNETEQAVIGKRFRDTFLSLGGGIPAGEIFRMFRGRDPSLDALPKHYGLIKMK